VFGSDGFRRILDSSPDLVSVIDRSGRFRYANAAHYRLLGLDPDALLDTDALEIVHPEDRPLAALEMRDVYSSDGTGNGLRLRVGSSTSGWVEVEIDGAFLRRDQDHPELVLVTRPVVNAEAASQEDTARLAAALRARDDASPDGVLLVAETGETISFNQKFLDMWGLTAEETMDGVGARIEQLSPMLKEPRAILGILRQIDRAPVETFDVVVDFRDGRSVEVHTAPLAGPGGEVYGRAWFYRDVTERVRAQQQLKQSEERYRRLVELSPNGIGVHQGGVLKYVNATGLRLLNATREEAVGENIFAFVHPDDREAVIRAALDRDFDTPRFVEARILRTDGEELTVEVASSATTFDGMPATQTVLRDITDRRRAERELEESESRYRSLVENAPDAIYVHDGSQVVYANRAAAELLGFGRPRDVIGLDPYELMRGVDRTTFQERVGRLLAGETFRVAERRFLTYAGREADVEISLAPATFGGNPVVQVMVRDVTFRRKEEEARLALERKMLETQKLESLGVLAGGIAHDFNNLLVAIMGNTGLALLEAGEDSPLAVYLKDIELASQRAADLARQMLAYSGKGRFIVEPVDLGAVVQEMTGLLSVSLPAEAKLEFALADPLPRVQGDITQIRQVVMNLVINAAEALGSAPGTLTLETSVVDVSGDELQSCHGAPVGPGCYVSLKVTDTGHGMDATTRARIFDPFFTTKFVGRGLGLAAVLGIVRGHRGLIRVTSAVGQGSTFEVLFPAAETLA